MKNLKIFALALLIGLGATAWKLAPAPQAAAAEEIQWHTWNEGYKLAKEQKKILLVDMYTSWCSWCKKMDKTTYSDKDVAAMINKYFIAVKLNPEKMATDYVMDSLTMDNTQLLSLLTNGQLKGYPSTAFVFPVEKEIVLEAGYLDEDQFTTKLELAISGDMNKCYNQDNCLIIDLRREKQAE